jgi:hypothetical protein
MKETPAPSYLQAKKTKSCNCLLISVGGADAVRSGTLSLVGSGSRSEPGTGFDRFDLNVVIKGVKIVVVYKHFFKEKIRKRFKVLLRIRR